MKPEDRANVHIQLLKPTPAALAVAKALKTVPLRAYEKRSFSRLGKPIGSGYRKVTA